MKTRSSAVTALGASRGWSLVAWAALLLGGCSLAGCASGSKAGLVRVVRADPPAVVTTGLLPPIPEEEGHAGLVVAPPGAFHAPNLVTFAEAREAFWSYETEKAVGLLRKLKAEEGISDDHFHYLVLQCYEQSGRWAETLPLYREFGIEESRRGWREWAEFRARLPERRIEFAEGAPAVPFTLKHGDLVIAVIEVNGVKARVMVDTGANLSWWRKGFARRAGLQFLDQTVALNDAHDQARTTDLVLLRELRIGGMTARNVPALCGRSLWFPLFIGVDGIVGWDLLQQANVVLDFPARRMTVEAPAGGVVEQPTLSGRVAPILTTRSAEGQPLYLFLDTGASGGSGSVALYANEGVLGTKTALAVFRRTWRPMLSLGMHSIRLSWPRRTKPFSFWMDGFRFETPGASLHEDVTRQEHMAYLDGLIGNTPFLGGKLTLCGVRRLVAFEPGAAVAAGRVMAMEKE